MHQEVCSGRTQAGWRATAVLISLVSLLGAWPTSAPAQGTARRASASPDSVRLVADLFFRAVADERWDAAAALVDTTVIRRLVAEQPQRPQRAAEIRDRPLDHHVGEIAQRVDDAATRLL